MSEARPSRNINFIPGVPFKVSPNFKEFDRNPVEFIKKAASTEYDEGVVVDRLGLMVARRPVGEVGIVAHHLGTDKLDRPTVFLAGVDRPLSLFITLKGLTDLEQDATIALLFQDQYYEAVTDVDEERGAGMIIAQYLWVKSGHKERVNLAFKRPELPEIDILIEGIIRPSALEMLQTKAFTLWEGLYRL